MSDLRTAAQQALEAWDGGDIKWFKRAYTVMENLRTALAQQAEPLNLRDPAVQKRLATQWGYVPAAQAEPVEPVAVPLIDYEALIAAAYAANKKWAQGTSGCVAFKHGAEWFRLQTLAAMPQQAEPVGQLAELQAMLRAEVDRLIAAGIQPQRKLVPLTEEEIMHIGMKHVTLREVIRAVERAHGIKE